MSGQVSSIYNSNAVRGKVRSRKDDNGQEAVIEMDKLRESVSELCRLKTKADEVKNDYSEAVKAVAEKSGLQSAVIRQYIAAKVAEKIETYKRNADQLSLVFEEIDKPALQASIASAGTA